LHQWFDPRHDNFLAWRCRQEAQQAREQLQARLTVLEGQVRFLTAGFQLRPSSHPQQHLLECSMPMQQQQPLMALPWTATTPTAAGRGQSPVKQQQLVVPPPLYGQQLTRSNPLFDAQQAAQHPAPLMQPGSGYGSGFQQAWTQAGPAACSGGCSGQGAAHAAATPSTVEPVAGLIGGTAAAAPQTQQQQQQQQQWQPQAALPAAPPTAVGPAPLVLLPEPQQARCYSNTTELISGMKASFSEAEDFLMSLQRL